LSATSSFGVEPCFLTSLRISRSAARAHGHAKRRHASIMVGLGGASQPASGDAGIVRAGRGQRSDHSLVLCRISGMSPTQYVLLRRLKEVRRELRDANLNIVSVAEVAHRFGFAELGRFAKSYRATFGETPLVTLQRLSGKRPPAL
jgi:methylphosphotriester-DNA--protein-cysteine methyltransferase